MKNQNKNKRTIDCECGFPREDATRRGNVHLERCPYWKLELIMGLHELEGYLTIRGMYYVPLVKKVIKHLEAKS